MTNKEVFISEIERHWGDIKERDDVIFENIAINIDADQRFEDLKEENNSFYWELLHEDSIYNKKSLIKEFFWDRIVGDLYESTLDIMFKAGLLEEAQKSFDRSNKIENTARLILENGVFARFSSSKKKELTENLIAQSFYPYSYQESNQTHLEVLNENAFQNNVNNAAAAFGRGITGSARVIKSLLMLLSFILISPATVIMANGPTRLYDSSVKGITGKDPSRLGMDPTMRKFYAFLDNASPVKIIYQFLNKDLIETASYLKKSNNLEDEYIEGILKEVGANPNKIVNKCWQQNNHQHASGDKESRSIMEQLKHFMSGKGLANMLRDPLYTNELQIAKVLKSDAADPTYQKMFYNFRVCVYEKLFEIILGYAKSIYSMDDASYEIITRANEVHKNKNFKAFFDLRPKQANEEAMFNVMKTLVAIDSIANTLEKQKGELVADKYIGKFAEFLRQNIKQTYQQLDEMAGQKKYNEDRYEEEDPDDETKAKKIAEERFNAKRSIFS